MFNVDKISFLISGIVLLAGLVLGYFFTPYALLLGVLVGLDFLRWGLTGKPFLGFFPRSRPFRVKNPIRTR